jgi:hypothetical protein
MDPIASRQSGGKASPAMRRMNGCLSAPQWLNLSGVLKRLEGVRLRLAFAVRIEPAK